MSCNMSTNAKELWSKIECYTGIAPRPSVASDPVAKTEQICRCSPENISREVREEIARLASAIR